MPSKRRVYGAGQTPEALRRALSGWRHTKGWNQDELAEATEFKVSKATISLIERNKHNWLPRDTTLNALAKAFGITIDQLFVHPDNAVIETFTRHVLASTEAATERRESGQIPRWEGAAPQAASLIDLPTIDLQRALPRFDAGSLRYLTVTDNAMAETLLPGDQAVIALDAPLSAGVYVLAVNGSYIIRRLIPHATPGMVRVSCDNARYALEPETMELERINPVARVVTVVRCAAID